MFELSNNLPTTDKSLFNSFDRMLVILDDRIFSYHTLSKIDPGHKKIGQKIIEEDI